MACVDRNGYFKPYKTDRNFYKLVKIRGKKICSICRNKILGGSYCLNGWCWGGGICLNCAEKVLEQGVVGVSDFLKDILNLQKIFKDRFQELKEKNMVNDL